MEVCGFLSKHIYVTSSEKKNPVELICWICRHFELNWAFVDPETPIQSGAKFCVCVKEFLPWVLMPLQVVYINESRRAKKPVASFGFGSGTLQGHLLVSVFFLAAVICILLRN